MDAMEITKANIDGNLKEVFIQCALMPNGEVIHLGKTIMRLHGPEDEHLQYLYERSEDAGRKIQEEPEG